jgi:phosphoribosylamine-glycine ligase
LAEQNVSSPNPKYFVGGVTKTPKGFAVKGGRVLGALGTGYSRDVARAAAYAHLKEISFPGMQFRNDVGAA